MKVIGGVVLGGWFVSMGFQRKTGFKFDRIVIVLSLFLVWCGVTVAFALEPEVALSQVFTYTQLALATLMFSSVGDTPGRMRGVYWSFVIWVTVSTLLRGGDQLFQTFVTHNAYMGLVAETGVVGLGLFLLISGVALRDARRAVFTGRVLARSDIEIFGVVAEVSLLV
jgi:hypothetical protein